MRDSRQLPLIPVRDFVLFPGSETPIYVGRETTVRAMKAANARYGNEVAVFTQRKIEDHDALTPDRLYAVGTRTKIVASIATTDETVKGMLEGKERVRLVDIAIVDGVPLATIVPEPNETDANFTLDEMEHASILELFSTWNADPDQDIERAEMHALTEKKDIASVLPALFTLSVNPRIDKPGGNRGWPSSENPIPARYLELKNEAVRLRQKILEENSYKNRVKYAIEALKFDINCRLEDLG